MVRLITYCLVEALPPSFKILLLPVCLKISHLDIGIQDKANEIDTAFIKDSVPLVKILKANLKYRNNLCIL